MLNSVQKRILDILQDIMGMMCARKCMIILNLFTQYSAKLGTADVDDVINNTLGAAIGWLLYLAFLKKVRWSKPKRKRKKKSA